MLGKDISKGLCKKNRAQDEQRNEQKGTVKQKDHPPMHPECIFAVTHENFDVVLRIQNNVNTRVIT